MMNAHGTHIFLDFTGYEAQVDEDGAWMLELLERAVAQSDARNVHAKVVQFDGTVSPVGFAAVVLLDESHVSAHCYSDQGWLAVDCFTCGESDPSVIADFIQTELEQSMPQLNLKQRRVQDRFLHGEV
jgi:S-adenosylmethionine decarboxylase